MKALELAATLHDLSEAYSYPNFTQMKLLEEELRRLAEVNAKLLDTLKFIRNHTSVNMHQIEVIDLAIAEAKEQQ